MKPPKAKDTATSRWLSYRPEIKVVDCVQNHIEPMRAKLLWGYDLPDLLTGMLNQHPRTAIRFKEAELSGAKGDVLAFYDSVTSEE